VLYRVFRSKRAEVTEEWRKLVELLNLQLLHSFTVIKAERTRLACTEGNYMRARWKVLL
jgi:hypothetical protein